MITAADLFCGAGGTSTGLIQAASALGLQVNLTAINHWEVAVSTHTTNHPAARHYCASLDALNPRDLYREGELDILLASPECTHHSVARGGRPINDQSRATAWCVVRWAEALRPRAIIVENVPEFLTWGAIDSKGKPMKSKKGAVFIAWVEALKALGYRVDWKVLCAADYGDPTTRRRLFVQAVRGNRKITWPEPTHAPAGESDLFGERAPWRGAREIIDWTIPSQSIYERTKPLSPKTMARIEAGLKKYGIKPYVVELRGTHDSQINSTANALETPLGTLTTSNHHGLVEPFLLPQQSGGQLRPVSEPSPTVATAGAIGLVEPFLVQIAHGDSGSNRSRSVDDPLPTVTGSNGWAIAEPFIVPYRGERAGQSPRTHSVNDPMPTVTAGATGHALVESFLVSYYGQGEALSLNDPLDTVTCKDRFGLCEPIMIDGQPHKLDIRFRMLQPHELAGAQGFPEGYQFTGGKTHAVKQIGNAVPVGLARALCANAITRLGI